MKRGIPKGDKKKKKDVTAEISKLEADLTKKHQEEIDELQKNATTTAAHDDEDQNQPEVNMIISFKGHVMIFDPI